MASTSSLVPSWNDTRWPRTSVGHGFWVMRPSAISGRSFWLRVMPASSTLSAGLKAPYCSGLPLVRTRNSLMPATTCSGGKTSAASAPHRVKAMCSLGTPALIFCRM